jgi:hypothetical protein
MDELKFCQGQVHVMLEKYLLVWCFLIVYAHDEIYCLGGSREGQKNYGEMVFFQIVPVCFRSANSLWNLVVSPSEQGGHLILALCFFSSLPCSSFLPRSSFCYVLEKTWGRRRSSDGGHEISAARPRSLRKERESCTWLCLPGSNHGRAHMDVLIG